MVMGSVPRASGACVLVARKHDFSMLLPEGDCLNPEEIIAKYDDNQILLAGQELTHKLSTVQEGHLRPSC